VRWPGSFGSAYLYFLIPRVILFRDVHTPRILVPKVAFISAPGSSPANVYRKGGPHALVTSKAIFAFNREKRRFRLASLHPGQDLQDLIDTTGFAFEHDAEPTITPKPDQTTLRLIASTIGPEVAETYPQFAERLMQDAVG
jgi:glutaconate CoA-transferase subunit B